MNILTAEIISIKTSGELSFIKLKNGGDDFSALIIAENESFIFVGNRVKMVFKETEVSLAKNFTGEMSLRNRFFSTVKSIKKGEILAEIKLDYGGEEITSIITSASAEAMKIEAGEEVVGMVKSNELMLMRND